MMKKLTLLLALLASSAPAAQTASGTTSPVTITSSSATYAAAAPRQYISISNQSATATISCRFGGTAAINGAGSYDLAPGVTRVWNSQPIPSDVFNCISSAATSPATLGAY